MCTPISGLSSDLYLSWKKKQNLEIKKNNHENMQL